MGLGIDDDVYLTAEGTCLRVEIDAVEIIADRIELMTALRKGARCTIIERTAVG